MSTMSQAGLAHVADIIFRVVVDDVGTYTIECGNVEILREVPGSEDAIVWVPEEKCWAYHVYTREERVVNLTDELGLKLRKLLD